MKKNKKEMELKKKKEEIFNNLSVSLIWLILFIFLFLFCSTFDFFLTTGIVLLIFCFLCLVIKYSIDLKNVGGINENDVIYASREKDYSKEYSHRMKAIKNQNKSSIEGIIDDKTKDLIDKDNDGRIMVSEFYPLSEYEVLSKIVKDDPNFSKQDFYGWVKKVFLVIQKAITTRDKTLLRSFEDDLLYYEHSDQIDDLINSNMFDRRKKIRIKGVLLKDYTIEGDKEFLVVALAASITRPTTDMNPNALFDYDVIDDYYYILTFTRTVGTKTVKSKSNKSTSNCPNCGAVIKVHENGVCDYCGTQITTGDYDWVLLDIKNIKLIDI